MPRKKKIESPAANVWGKILTGDANEYLPLFEFAKELKLKEEYLIGLAKSGRLKAFKIDDYWLSTSQWVGEWLDEVKGHLHREIEAESEKTAVESRPAREIIPAIPEARPAVKKSRTKAAPSFYRETAEIKRELLEEIEKENNKDAQKKWVQYVNNSNSFKTILNTPLKLAWAPQQASSHHYALILALFLILATGLFICTVALAGF